MVATNTSTETSLTPDSQKGVVDQDGDETLLRSLNINESKQYSGVIGFLENLKNLLDDPKITDREIHNCLTSLYSEIDRLEESNQKKKDMKNIIINLVESSRRNKAL